MPGAVGAPLITAVMQRSMQSYLEREVRIDLSERVIERVKLACN
jgi:hypothetical protein